MPLVGVADGVGFGTGLWLIGDEVMMPLMGLSPPSTEFPWQNHARAFANHFAYGATLGITHSLLRSCLKIDCQPDQLGMFELGLTKPTLVS